MVLCRSSPIRGSRFGACISWLARTACPGSAPRSCWMASGWWPLLQVPGSEWMPAAGSATLVLTRRINLALENEIASVLAVDDARFDAMTNNDVDALQMPLDDDLPYVHLLGRATCRVRVCSCGLS